MQYRLRSLFVAITIASLIVGVIAWIRNHYYVQLRTVNAVLADYPELGNIWLCTNDDITLEVEELYFSTVDQPGLTYGIYGIDGASESEIRERLQDALREKRAVERPNGATEHR